MTQIWVLGQAETIITVVWPFGKTKQIHKVTIFIQNGLKKFIWSKKSCHFMNLLNSAVKRLHNSNYCLNLTWLGLKSKSSESVNLKKRVALKD